MTKTDQTIHEAVSEAIRLVNTKPGLTYVHLRFADDPYEVDFVANSASAGNGRFEFQAGIETYEGRIEELSEIRTETIVH